MKLRIHIVPVFWLLVGLACLIPTKQAAAQEIFEGPFYAPQRTTLCQGVFYTTVGIRWWNLLFADMKLNPQGYPGFSFGPVFALESQTMPTRITGPTFELGWQQDSFFDLFLGFSMFDYSTALSRTALSTDDFGTFQTLHLGYRLAFQTYQVRFGGRSWYPLWGMGRFGVYLGGIFGVAPYRVDVATNLSGPTPLGVSASHSDTWYQGLGILGLDVDLSYGRFFFRGSVEGQLGGPTMTYEFLQGVSTKIQPSALSAAASLGVRF